MFRWLLDSLYNNLLERDSKNQKKITFEFETQKDEETRNLHKKLSKEWFIQGNPVLSKEGFIVTNTNSGCLIMPTYLFNINFLKIWNGHRVWKNLKATIKVEYKKQNSYIQRKFKFLLGVVFKAQSHDDYFMVELWKKDKLIVMRPHVRVSGNWDAPILNPDSSSYQLKNDNTLEFTYIINIDEDVLTVVINEDEKNQLIWDLPSHYEINLIQYDYGKQKGISESAVRKIPFKDKAGMFGFRNYGDEIATVKSLIIEPSK